MSGRYLPGVTPVGGRKCLPFTVTISGNHTGPSYPYGITEPTKAGHQYNKTGRVSRVFPDLARARKDDQGQLARTPRGLQETQSIGLGMEAGDGLRFVAVDIENGIQLGDLQKVADFLVQLQEF
jgi:hypothetical protein